MQVQESFDISLIDMIMCLADAMDLVSSKVSGHHKRVAYIAAKLADKLKLSGQQKKQLMMASALHDVGALSLEERLDTLDFELDIANELGLSKHSVLGYRLLDNFSPFKEIASIVLYHHVDWEEGAGAEFRGEQIPQQSHILHLADRIDVLIEKEVGVLKQVDRIRDTVVKEAGSKFLPETVEAFSDLASKDFFWLNAISAANNQLIADEFGRTKISLDLDGLYNLGKFFSQIIDFRSHFTATHSSGVAASAEGLADFIGLSFQQVRRVKVAGYLHDLGKLSVPTEILEKPDKLTDNEYSLIQEHAYYTYHSLASIEGLDEISKWASFHHERLDGKGYPFQYSAEKLPLESRIIAVADVFTAITEDRPYREGMDSQQALNILEDMARDEALDEEIVLVLKNNYQEIDCLRKWAQEHEAQEYKNFSTGGLSS
ncbi:HD-GYP domain-containing protein [Fuchsiella alkaliacetigena]|uniref:HD-GYP domain-containing protein n=1 Tax=Fuchsiella alkaliacetigena TaxID=957042 RepID=UPI00200AE585|nr:HD domain-containing phosphohydrolase [Fuchsiella alkaliacetigena]MCK8824925.1 HD domain-containing protein [Fuchsiella alkaliacetigena]